MTPMEITMRNVQEDTLREGESMQSHNPNLPDTTVNVPTTSCAIDLEPVLITAIDNPNAEEALPVPDMCTILPPQLLPAPVEDIKLPVNEAGSHSINLSEEQEFPLEESGTGWGFEEQSPLKVTSRFKLSLLQKLNKNYNNLLQMFINKIAQRNMINKAVKRDYGDTKRFCSSSSSKSMKQPTIADMLAKIERNSASFENLLADTQVEHKV